MVSRQKRLLSKIIHAQFEKNLTPNGMPIKENAIPDMVLYKAAHCLVKTTI